MAHKLSVTLDDDVIGRVRGLAREHSRSLRGEVQEALKFWAQYHDPCASSYWREQVARQRMRRIEGAIDGN